MIFVLLRVFILLMFLGLPQDAVNAMVPRTLVCPDLAGGLFSSPREGRHLSIKAVFDSSDEAYDDAIGTLGVFQRFDLNDLAKSADIYSQEYSSVSYTPEMLQLIPDWRGKPIVFDTISSIRVERVVFSYSDFISIADCAAFFKESPIKRRLVEGGSICFGVSFPLIQVQSTNRYELNRSLSLDTFKQNLPAMDEKAERLRAELFNKIGLGTNVWDYAGVGDLHAYIGVVSHNEYFLRLRTLDLGVLFGALLPTGMQRDQNYPSSLPLSISSVGMSLQGYLELGLKDYLRAGIMTGLVFARPKQHELRLPVYQEPAAFSPLLMTTRLEPGMTGWLNPYFKINNVANNLHLTLNYAYVLHGQDYFFDVRATPRVASVLTRSVDGNTYGVTNDARVAADNRLHAQSAWRTRHAGVALTYEPYQADKAARVRPLFTLGCQISHRGLNVPKMYHLLASVAFQF